MKDEELEFITNSMQEKIGKEASALISDDIASLITMNRNIQDKLKENDSKISKLTDTNEKLILANGNLLKQIPVSADYEKHQSEDKKEEKKSFNFRDAFDKNGHFKK